MKKTNKNIIKLVEGIDDKQKVKEICDYASDSFDKVIILGMKKIDNEEEYRIIGNYRDEKEIIWNLECAKLSVLRQN